MTPRTNRPPKPAADVPPAPPRRPHHIHLSRRSFIPGAALIGAGAAATAVFRLNDGGKTDSEVAGAEATPKSTIAKAPAGSRGGILRTYNFDAMPYDSLDPHLTMMGPIANMHAAVFSRLLRFDDEVAGSIVPDLAVAMPEQPDDTTYVFQIRDGIRFHDTERFRRAFPATAGRLLTADDVRLSIERQMDRTSPQARRMFRSGNWDVIDRIEVPDARTLILRTREPIAPMLSFFAGRHAFVIPSEVLDRADQITSADACIGTGPFVLDSLEDRVAMRLRRNPQWFARDDDPATGGARPYIDGYDAFLSPQEDVFQRFTFDRSSVDMTGFVDQGELGRAHAANLEDIAIEQVDAGSVLAMRLLLDRPPFLDDRARRALHLALDRTALTNLLFPIVDGAPSARPSAAIPPGVKRWALDSETVASKPGFRSDPDGRALDVREAKQLWDAAMGSTPVDLRIFFAGIPRTIPERAIEAVRAQLQGTLGVNLISQVDPSGHALLANAFMRNLDGATEGAITCTFAFEDGGVDLDDCLYPHFRSGEAMNTYRLQDPQLDSLLDQQRREFDTATRRQIGLDAQEYLLANVNARIEICAPVERRLVWGYVRNSRMPLWHGSTQDLADVWLDKSHPAFASRPA